MYRHSSLAVVAGLILGLGVCGQASAEEAAAPSVAVLAPQDIRYVEDAKVPGVGVAVVAGDPRTGHYTLRVRFAARVKVPAHAHPDDRTVTVLGGTYYFGVGNRYDERGLVAHGPGTVIVVPRGVAHYAAAGEEEVVLQETGPGPTANTVPEPAPGPRPRDR